MSDRPDQKPKPPVIGYERPRWDEPEDPQTMGISSFLVGLYCIPVMVLAKVLSDGHEVIAMPLQTLITGGAFGFSILALQRSGRRKTRAIVGLIINSFWFILTALASIVLWLSR